MSEIVDKAFAALKALPKEDADRIAWEILQRVDDMEEWSRIVFSDKAQQWLEKTAADVLKKYRKIAERVTMNIIALPPTTLRMRGDSYWRFFDELPEEQRKLADQNFNLWKKDPTHPSLRFRKIHKTMPIFSFRVGMNYRTVGVQTEDGRVVWFWVGPFEQFRQMVEEDIRD